MLAQELTIEEANRDVEAVKSEKFQIFLPRDVDFLKLITTMKLLFQLLDELIAKRAVVMSVKRDDW